MSAALHDDMKALMLHYRERARTLRETAHCLEMRAEECLQIAADINVELKVIRSPKPGEEPT